MYGPVPLYRQIQALQPGYMLYPGCRARAAEVAVLYAITLLLLLDLSRTPGAVCQSIHSRNAPEVDAGSVPVSW